MEFCNEMYKKIKIQENASKENLAKKRQQI